MGGGHHINKNLHRAFLNHDFSLEQDISQFRIRSHGFGVSTRCRRNHDSSLDLPPACKGLGPFTTRGLPKHVARLYLAFRLQHGYRFDHHSPTDANGLEDADGHTQKDRAHNYLCSWLHVRASIYTFLHKGADLSEYSVCVVSMIRLVIYMHIYLNDLYSQAWINVVSLLEPLIGIVVACLPLFRPAIRKVVDHMRKTKPETRNVLSSSMARLRMKRSKSSAFQSLVDLFPLTDLEAQGTQNRITGPRGKPDEVFEGYGDLAGFRIPPQSSIMVERDLEVRSDDANYIQGK